MKENKGNDLFFMLIVGLVVTYMTMRVFSFWDKSMTEQIMNVIIFTAQIFFGGLAIIGLWWTWTRTGANVKRQRKVETTETAPVKEKAVAYEQFHDLDDPWGDE